MKRALATLLAVAFLACPALLPAAEPAPGFSLSKLDGGSVCLSSLKGKVVVLNFFRTFCPYCVKEVPELNDISQRLGSQVAVVGMGLDGADLLKRFVAGYNVRYPVVVVSPEVLRAYSDVSGTGGLRGVPVTVVVGPNGQVGKVFLGLAPKGSIESEVRRLLPTS